MRPARLTAASLVCLLLSGLFFAIVAPSPSLASRGPFDLTGRETAEAQRIADEHWGGRPCGGRIAMRWADAGNPELNAVSSWTGGRTGYVDCSIVFNSGASWDPAKFCTVLVHELGHLSGQRHALAPHELMSAYYDTPLPACAAALGVPG